MLCFLRLMKHLQSLEHLDGSVLRCRDLCPSPSCSHVYREASKRMACCSICKVCVRCVNEHICLAYRAVGFNCSRPLQSSVFCHLWFRMSVRLWECMCLEFRKAYGENASAEWRHTASNVPQMYWGSLRTSSIAVFITIHCKGSRGSSLSLAAKEMFG